MIGFLLQIDRGRFSFPFSAVQMPQQEQDKNTAQALGDILFAGKQIVKRSRERCML